MSGLSHIDEGSGSVHMVDVGSKPVVQRRAVASATVRLSPGTAERLRALPKGDAFVVAQIAGIQAAKGTAGLIPLCHPLPLSSVDVALEIVGDTVVVTTVAQTTAQTGVEMEALTGAAVAALTVYDMAKAVDPAMEITGIRLLEKTKGQAAAS